VPVRLLEERRFDPPRLVEVEDNGAWWPAFQTAWRLCDDGRGWMADCSWSERYEWGLGKHLAMVPPERLQPTAGEKRDRQPSR
jgi:hypothetical protein